MEELNRIIGIYKPDHIIGMGDYNITLDEYRQKDVRNKDCLISFLQENNMFDMVQAKVRLGSSKEYTFFPKSARAQPSRLDYVFCSENLFSNYTYHKHSGIWFSTDHEALRIRGKPNIRVKKPLKMPHPSLANDPIFLNRI